MGTERGASAATPVLEEPVHIDVGESGLATPPCGVPHLLPLPPTIRRTHSTKPWSYTSSSTCHSSGEHCLRKGTLAAEQRRVASTSKALHAVSPRDIVAITDGLSATPTTAVHVHQAWCIFPVVRGTAYA